jgi:hypothetical protein
LRRRHWVSRRARNKTCVVTRKHGLSPPFERPCDRNSSIKEIAEREVADVVARLVERGYEVAVAPEVTELIATSGYDSRYGARHLQRNLEQLLLMPLAAFSERSLRAEVLNGTVSWLPDAEKKQI